MMKKQNGFQLRLIQASVLATLILPQSIFAEYESIGDLQTDTAKVGDILDTTKVPTDADGNVDVKKLTEQRRIEAQKKLDATKEEIDRVGKIGKWRDKIDNLNASSVGMKAAEQAALKKRSADLKSLDKLSGALADSTSFVDPNAFNMGDIADSCQKGVDFSQARSLLEKMNSEGGQYLMKEIRKFADEKRKDVKEGILKNMNEIVKQLEKNADLTAELDSKSSPDVFKQDNSPASREKRQKEALKELKETHKELTKSVLGQFVKFTGGLLDLKDNDRKVSEMCGEFAKVMKSTRDNSRTSVLAGLKKLKRNCEKIRTKTQTEVASLAQPLKQYLVQNGTEETLATNSANFDTQQQMQRVQQIRCTDVSADADAIFSGGNFDSILSTMQSQKNPTACVNDALSAMNAVKQMQADIGPVIEPLKENCDVAAKRFEEAQTRKAQIAPQGGTSSTGSVASAGSSRNSGQFTRSRNSGGSTSTHR